MISYKRRKKNTTSTCDLDEIGCTCCIKEKEERKKERKRGERKGEREREGERERKK